MYDGERCPGENEKVKMRAVKKCILVLDPSSISTYSKTERPKGRGDRERERQGDYKYIKITGLSK